MVKEVCFGCNKTKDKVKSEVCPGRVGHTWHYVSEQEYQYHKEELANGQRRTSPEDIIFNWKNGEGGKRWKK